jgi:hypothetical protein
MLERTMLVVFSRESFDEYLSGGAGARLGNVVVEQFVRGGDSAQVVVVVEVLFVIRRRDEALLEYLRILREKYYSDSV